MSSTDATTPAPRKRTTKAPAGPRKPVKATITRTLKAAGLIRYVDGGMFGQSVYGFEPTDGRGGIVEVQWRYPMSAQRAARELFGERNEDRPSLLPQQEGHGQQVADAKAALEAYGYAVVETVHRGLRGLAVLPEQYAWDMERRAARAAAAEAEAEALLPAGEWFTVTADRVVRCDYTRGSGDREWALALLVELIKALCAPVEVGERNNGYMHAGSRPVLVMKDLTLFSGVMAPWRTYAFEVTERPAGAPAPMAEGEPQERRAVEAGVVPAAAAPSEAVGAPVEAVEVVEAAGPQVASEEQRGMVGRVEAVLEAAGVPVVGERRADMVPPTGAVVSAREGEPVRVAWLLDGWDYAARGGHGCPERERQARNEGLARVVDALEGRRWTVGTEYLDPGAVPARRIALGVGVLDAPSAALDGPVAAVDVPGAVEGPGEPQGGAAAPLGEVEQRGAQVPPLMVRLGPEGEGVWSVSSPVCRGALGAVLFVAGSGGGEGHWKPVGRSAVHDRVPCPAGADREAAVVALVDYQRARWSDPAVLGEVGAPVRVVEAEYGDDEGARMEAQRRIRGVYPSDSAGERASRAVWLVLRDGGLRMAVQAGLTSGEGQELWEEGLEVGGHLGWARVVYMAAHPQQKGDGTAYPCWDGSQRSGGGGGLRERRSDALAQARRLLVAAGWQVREVLTDGNGDGAAGALWCLEVWRVPGTECAPAPAAPLDAVEAPVVTEQRGAAVGDALTGPGGLHEVVRADVGAYGADEWAGPGTVLRGALEALEAAGVVLGVHRFRLAIRDAEMSGVFGMGIDAHAALLWHYADGRKDETGIRSAPTRERLRRARNEALRRYRGVLEAAGFEVSTRGSSATHTVRLEELVVSRPYVAAAPGVAVVESAAPDGWGPEALRGGMPKVVERPEVGRLLGVLEAWGVELAVLSGPDGRWVAAGAWVVADMGAEGGGAAVVSWQAQGAPGGWVTPGEVAARGRARVGRALGMAGYRVGRVAGERGQVRVFV